jgi:hypothetical protein
MMAQEATTRFREFDVNVRIVTPAFVAGANQHASQEELQEEGVRVASIVSGMRWWFRALAGGIWGSTRLKEIRNAESLIFGSAGAVDGVRKVRFESVASRLRLSIADSRFVAQYVQRAKDLIPPILYLGYGLYPQKWGDKGRAYLDVGSRFTVHAEYCPERSSPGEPRLDERLLSGLLKLWVRFGGLGGRWRHGLGGMAVEELVPPGDPCDGLGRTMIEIRRLVADLLRRVDPGVRAVPESTLPLFPVVSPDFLRLAAAPRTFTWQDALAEVHRLWRNTRLNNPRAPRSGSRNVPLFRAMVDGMPPARPHVLFAGLGLPIPFGFPQYSSRPTGAVKPSGGLERRASPIWFRLHPASGSTGQNRYHLFAVLWLSQYLPPESDGRAVVAVDKGGAQATADFDSAEAGAWFQERLLEDERWREV